MDKKVLCLFFVLVLLAAGCDNAQEIPVDTIGDSDQQGGDAAQAASADNARTGIPSSSREESDGNSGGDAPDKFQDGLVELQPGEYTDNALLRIDDFDDTSDDVDFYKFTVGAGEWFKLTITPVKDLDVQLLMYDAGGKEDTWTYTYYHVDNPEGGSVFKLNAGIAGKEEGFWSQMGSEEQSYTYYFSVQSISGKGHYTIQLETKQQNDGNAGKDAGEKPAKAVALEPGTEYNALLNYNDVMDCYRLSTGARASVTVAPTEDLDVSFTIHDEGGKDVTWYLTYYKKTDKKDSVFKIDSADTGLPESVTWDTGAGMQYICVKKEEGHGDYTVQYS